MKQQVEMLNKNLVDERCKSVLDYLIPGAGTLMSAKQYNNAIEALRTIAYGTSSDKK